MKNLKHIDFLRAIAIILVVLCHVSQTQSTLNYYFKGVMEFGAVGVQLFFFLSAYTLCLSMDNSNKPNSIFNFYIRRYFRIAPLYYLGILIYYLVSLTSSLNEYIVLSNNKFYTSQNVLINLLFLHGLVEGVSNRIVPGGWSIGTEMLFYLIFPFLFSYIRKFNRLKLFVLPFIALGLCNAALFVIYLFDRSVYINSFYYCSLLNQLPVFIIGISYYFLEKAHLKKFNNFVNGLLFCLLILISITLNHRANHYISLGVFFAGLSFTFLFEIFKGIKVRLPLLKKVGQLSYSIYMFHFLFAYPLIIRISELLILHINSYILYLIASVITLLCSMLVASLSQVLIERPGMKLGSFLTDKLNVRLNNIKLEFKK